MNEVDILLKALATLNTARATVKRLEDFLSLHADLTGEPFPAPPYGMQQ